MLESLESDENDALRKLIDDIKPLPVSEINGEKLTGFQKRLLDIFTLDRIKKRSDYRDTLREFVLKHPDTQLFPLIGLKDSNPHTRPIYVNLLLASLESSVIAAPSLQATKEGHTGIFSSPLFDNWVIVHVISFFKYGQLSNIHKASISDLINIYIAADALGVNRLRDIARDRLISEIKLSNIEDFESLLNLWKLAELYSDPGLQYACIRSLQKLPDEQQISEQLPQKLREQSRHFKELSLNTYIEPFIWSDGLIYANLRNHHLTTIALCKKLGIERVVIPDVSSQVLRELESCSSIKHANLQFYDKDSTYAMSSLDGIISLLRHNQSLCEIHIGSLNPSNCNEQEVLGRMKELASALEKRENLTVFEWIHTSLNPSMIKILADSLSNNPSLTHLTLHANLDDKGLAEIAKALKTNFTLHHLCLKGNCFSENAIKSFEQLLATHRPRIKVEWT